MMLTLPELVYNFQEKQTKCFKLRVEKIFLLSSQGLEFYLEIASSNINSELPITRQWSKMPSIQIFLLRQAKVSAEKNNTLTCNLVIMINSPDLPANGPEDTLIKIYKSLGAASYSAQN